MYDFQFINGNLNINDLHEITTVTNIEQTKQDLEHRLMCVKGSDVFHPDYGLDLLKIKRTPFNRVLIEHEIRKALKTHDNIKSIDEIKITKPWLEEHMLAYGYGELSYGNSEYGDLEGGFSERKITITVYLTLISEEAVAVEVAI